MRSSAALAFSGVGETVSAKRWIGSLCDFCETATGELLRKVERNLPRRSSPAIRKTFRYPAPGSLRHQLPITMSALPVKADMCDATGDVRFGPKADIAVHHSGHSCRQFPANIARERLMKFRNKEELKCYLDGVAHAQVQAMSKASCWQIAQRENCGAARSPRAKHRRGWSCRKRRCGR